MLIFMANFTYASSFDVKVIPVKDKIVVDETAEFDFLITNNLQTDEEFTIKKAGYPFWDMYTMPLQNPISLKVGALSSGSIKLFVDPLYITSVDTYTLDAFIVLERTGEEQKVPITIGIKSTDPLIGGYIPTVLTTTEILPDKIDPRKEFKIRVTLNNQNPINYPNLTIRIESELFKDEAYYPLDPKEEKAIEITEKLDDVTPPRKDKLIIAIFQDKRMIVSPMVKEFTVEEYIEYEEIPKEKSFLKHRSGTKIISNNPLYDGHIKIETTPFKKLFVTTYPKADMVKENGKYYLVWETELKQNEMSVYVTENYRPIVVISLAAIVALALYFVFRSPIVIRKSVANIGLSEGGVSGAKIIIRVKNRSPKQILGIEVLDHLPHLAHVEKDVSIGSMQPHAVLQHPKKGLVIKWAIESLEAGDERVLSYRMRSRLPILGEFNLPAATARCKANNRIIIRNSNRVTVGN